MNAMNRFAGLASLLLAATGCGGPEELEPMEEQLEFPAPVETGTELTGELEGQLTETIALAKVVTLQVKASGLCLDVGKGRGEKGSPIRQYPCHGGDNQKFRLTPAKHGYYRVISVSSGLCVDIANVTKLQLLPCDGGSTQEFNFRADGGYYQIKLWENGKCLEAQQTRPLPEARIQQAKCHDRPDQRFKLKAQ